MPSDYEILGVPANASREQIDAAYRRLVQMYHPDKVESLAPEHKAISEAKIKEINAAYARLKSRFDKRHSCPKCGAELKGRPAQCPQCQRPLKWSQKGTVPPSRPTPPSGEADGGQHDSAIAVAQSAKAECIKSAPLQSTEPPPVTPSGSPPELNFDFLEPDITGRSPPSDAAPPRNTRKTNQRSVPAMRTSIVVGLVLICILAWFLFLRPYSLQGTWQVYSPGTERFLAANIFVNDANKSLLSPALSGAVEFRSDGSITSEVGKVEGLTWHGDYICLKADIKKIREGREPTLRSMGRLLYSDESIAQQVKDLKDGKVMEGDAYCPLARGIDKKDISESADKVEFRVHWVDRDHFDLGSTSFSRVKETR